jgi:hypothetical protein
MIRPELQEAIEMAIAELDRMHRKATCLLGDACPTRATIHRLRQELHFEMLEAQSTLPPPPPPPACQ